MLKGLVLVCGNNFHSNFNKSLRQVRTMLLGRWACRGMSEIEISSFGSISRPGALKLEMFI